MARGRVLLVCGGRGIPLYGPSGASAHLRGVARALVRAGHDVGVHAKVSDHRGVVVDPVGAPLVDGEAWRPDWIWERAVIDEDLGARLAARWGVPRLVEVNAPLVDEHRMYGGLRREARALDRERTTLAADRVVVVSAWLAEWVVRERGVDPAKIRHVPNGTDCVRPGDRDGTRARLGWTGKVAGFVGSGRSWHGVDRLPEILERAPGWTVAVLGADAPAHPRVVGLGRVPPAALPDLVGALDVGLAPYPDDAPGWFCPLKLLDYRAQGVPFVTADVGDARVLAEGAGVVVGGEPADWAAALETAAAMPRIRRVRPWDDVVAEAVDGLGW